MGFSTSEESPNPSKRCKFLASTLKHAFANCHSFRKRHSTRIPEEDDPTADYYDQEVSASAVINKYMELKGRRKTTISTDKFSWAFSPTTGDLFISARLRQKLEDNKDGEKEEIEDFFSVDTHLSRCSSATSFEAFTTATTTFSRSSSLDRIHFQELRRISVIQELSHCEGWPFGLYRKALLLPPLPKSPSDSWSWHERPRLKTNHL